MQSLIPCRLHNGVRRKDATTGGHQYSAKQEDKATPGDKLGRDSTQKFCWRKDREREREEAVRFLKGSSHCSVVSFGCRVF